jgi:hypothetical protein
MEEENKNEPQACTRTFEEVFSADESDQAKDFLTFFSDHTEAEDTIQSIPHEDEIDEESFAQIIDLIGKDDNAKSHTGIRRLRLNKQFMSESFAQNHTGCKDGEGCQCVDFQAMPTDALERLIAEIRAMSLSWATPEMEPTQHDTVSHAQAMSSWPLTVMSHSGTPTQSECLPLAAHHSGTPFTEPTDDFEIIDDVAQSLSSSDIDYELVEDEEVIEWLSDTNVFEYQADDLMPLDDDDPEFEMAIAIDSGAVDHVASEDDVPGAEIAPSPASRAGRYFQGANGKTIENKGQSTVRMRAKDTDVRINSIFQIAQVSRPLYSVSKICDTGCEVHFTKDEGRVTRNGKLIAAFPRRGGLYIGTLIVKPGDPKSAKNARDAPFVRQE